MTERRVPLALTVPNRGRGDVAAALGDPGLSLCGWMARIDGRRLESAGTHVLHAYAIEPHTDTAFRLEGECRVTVGR
jgi:hypothetical protein